MAFSDAHAADAEDDLLLDAGFAIAAVEPRRELAIPGRVLLEIGVEEEQLDAAEEHLPDRHEDGAIPERHGDDARPAVGPDGGLDRRVDPIQALVDLLLPAFRRHGLVKIALRIHEADADERNRRGRSLPCSDRRPARPGRRRRSGATDAARTRRRSRRSGPFASPCGGATTCPAPPVPRRARRARRRRSGESARPSPAARAARARRAGASARGCAPSAATAGSPACERPRGPGSSRSTRDPWRARAGDEGDRVRAGAETGSDKRPLGRSFTCGIRLQAEGS